VAELHSDGAQGRAACPAIDPDALLCALVLTPSAWSRNRFFGLFQDPALAHARRRAAVLRGLLRQVQRHADARLRFEQHLEGGAVAVLEVESLGYRRSSVLSAIERALVEYAVARARGLTPDESARTHVESALARMAP
jgi:hypothetical protein